jgi:predicted HTH transcriptional regulator
MWLRKPEFRQDEDFMVVMWRRDEAQEIGNETTGDSVNDRLSDSRNDRLSDSVNRTYLAIKENPGIQRKGISKLTGKSIPTIDRHLSFLTKSRLIEHRDSDKTGGYYVKK